MTREPSVPADVMLAAAKLMLAAPDVMLAAAKVGLAVAASMMAATTASMAAASPFFCLGFRDDSKHRRGENQNRSGKCAYPRHGRDLRALNNSLTGSPVPPAATSTDMTR
jgi:hypothetical protein